MSLAQRFDDFAQQEARGNSSYYEHLAHAIADDPALLTLFEQLPEPKRQPNLLLAAARFHVGTTLPYTDFRAGVHAKWQAIAQTALTRATQTNECGRAATLLPVLASLPWPLTLIEVGASAGLCLYPDRFSYRYNNVELHPKSGVSTVILECATTGPVPLPVELPEVVGRFGIDLNPLNVRDRNDMDWLATLVWPGQDERLARLRAAAKLAAAEPPSLRGDLNETISDLVTSAAGDSTVVVFHSAVMNYLTVDARNTFRERVRSLPCHWISQEGPRVLPQLSTRIPPYDPAQARFVLALNEQPLAFAGPHGQSLDWFGQIG
ncbi:DUF2332 domain-containing protein [Nocardia camponoti]|uniref:DUF2332 family protein n=1 Tax=Nocardia camponoti TaxID=1616106 RepID=A0A917QQS2_9NOCA|nr:DUF2332 domain-containing protein [Nocardia camponoti]GGK63777.1 hypothetical protein GCM10011591_40060 [Nocardia camponoti]